MDREDITFLGFLILGIVVVVGLATVIIIPAFDIGFAQNQTQFNKTGYVTDIDFIGGGFGGNPVQTIIRFDDGDVVVLQYWKTKIPIKQNITLHYHDNGYGRYFLDGFKVLGEKLKEEKK